MNKREKDKEKRGKSTKRKRDEGEKVQRGKGT